MKKLGLFIVAAAAAVLLSPVVVPTVATMAHAQQAKSKGQSLRGVVRPSPKRGGYSYSVTDSINTRKFTDPTIEAQTRSGPFDSGFFFSSPARARGGDSPYMN